MLFIASAKVHASFDLQSERHAAVDLNQTTRAPDAVAPGHDLAVDQERLHLEALRSVNDSREAVAPVMTAAREADAQAVPAHKQPVAIMLDLMNPERARRWPRRHRQQARFDEAGGTPQVHGRSIGHRLQPRYWRQR
jgi:hypothetical protein